MTGLIEFETRAPGLPVDPCQLSRDAVEVILADLGGIVSTLAQDSVAKRQILLELCAICWNQGAVAAMKRVR
jgi:hypothetical protein